MHLTQPRRVVTLYIRTCLQNVVSFLRVLAPAASDYTLDARSVDAVNQSRAHNLRAVCPEVKKKKNHKTKKERHVTALKRWHLNEGTPD